ncbi:hypothetical protein [Aquimarina litoralis]|uniref:hypothetical protein n=1 Tax=Aquimarina litoralis TaxID=584605 RepID=UPI001C599B25|nr:hypothetical protein [Aquimarina litoralis]MBW1296353.1 hypothetical protein [Aquimarina litoralis]
MKKLILILILNCLLICCGRNNSEKKSLATEKPTQDFSSLRFMETKLVEYDIDSLANFNEILKILDKIDCLSEYAMFKLDTEEKIYRIQPLQICESIFDYKLRQILYINSDKVTVNHQIKFPIDSLKKVLKNHLLNPNNDENYPSLTDKKLISINVDNNKDISEVKRLLLRIVSDVNELGAKVNFSFIFENHGIIKVIEE